MHLLDFSLLSSIVIHYLKDILGGTLPYYKNLENDKANPSLRMYKKIMRTLNISSDTYIHPETQTDNPLYDKIVRLLHKCSPDLFPVILATTEALLDLSHDSQDTIEK